jgi:hypothetical protein
VHSNNDLMDPNWRPSESDAFEMAWAKFYSEFNGVPNIVHVKNWAHKFHREALATARREGAQEMRERAANVLDRCESAHGNDNGHAHASIVRALPLEKEEL